MTSATAIPRYTLCILLAFVLAACSQPRDAHSAVAVDLLRIFDRAEKRPPIGFDVSSYALAGVDRAAIVAPVPSRVIWSMAFPRRAIFRTAVAAQAASGASAGRVRVRVGVSDERIYEGLAEAVLTPGAPSWIDLEANLSAYAGRKWSVFYHPDRITWRLVLASDPLDGAPPTVVWATPQILTDTGSALEYVSHR
jgi:hypothetical protein